MGRGKDHGAGARPHGAPVSEFRARGDRREDQQAIPTRPARELQQRLVLGDEPVGTRGVGEVDELLVVAIAAREGRREDALDRRREAIPVAQDAEARFGRQFELLAHDHLRQFIDAVRRCAGR